MTEKDYNVSDVSVTDQEREHAQTALSDFNKANYTGCLQHLLKLENRSQDPKVLHNRIVAEFYKSEQRKVDTFRKNLTSVFNQAKIKQDVIDDVEQSVFHYNQAVLLYHQRKYNEALRIVDKIYKFIEPMERDLAQRVCLLLIELHLCTQQHTKALTLIACIEIQFGLTDKQSDKKEEQQNIGSSVNPFRLKLMYHRARCYLMSHELKSAEKEIESIAQVEGLHTSTLCLKAHLEYLKGKQNAAISLFNTSPIDSINFREHGESSTVIFYNNMGLIYHAIGKSSLASYYFRQALKEDQKLSKFSKIDNGELNRPLCTLGASKYHELMYNLGISLLHAGQGAQAFDCLIIAVQRFHRNSRLWLRIAECCIQVHKSNNEYDFNIVKRRNEFVERTIGVGKHRKIILASHLSKDKKYSMETQTYAVPVATLEFASLCLRNALLLLPSETVTSPVPLLLLPGVVQPPPPPPSPGPSPSAPLNRNEIISLKNSVLAASAYVSLCLGDYVLTFEHANTLLGQPKLSGTHKMLGHMYAAEALVLMNKLPKAIDYLNSSHLIDISLTIPQEEVNELEDSTTNTMPPRKWFPDNMNTAHNILQYNLAVALAVKGEYEKSAELLENVWTSHNSTSRIPVHVTMLFLYIQLRTGHPEIVRSFIKRFCLLQR